MNKIALDLAKRFEGYKPGPYLCPAGIPTSGYGHAWKKNEKPRPLNLEEAELYLSKDLNEARNALYRLSPIIIKETEYREAALIDFIFNLGAGRYQGSTLRRKVNSCDYEGAKIQIIKWVFATNPKTGRAEKLRGLLLRRQAEALLI